jgi:hypothetical protein
LNFEKASETRKSYKKALMKMLKHGLNMALNPPDSRTTRPKAPFDFDDESLTTPFGKKEGTEA